MVPGILRGYCRSKISRKGHLMPELAWVKSSLSFSNGNCVEVAGLPGGGAAVRDSKDPEGPVLRFTPAEWDAFLGGAKGGEFDRLTG
jgi:Domain of unknown function (DUF397)